MKLRTSLFICSALVGGVAFGVPAIFASSHREAPAIAGMPRVDGTDLYMFRSYEPGREDYVTFIANYIPLQDPYGGPNFYTLDNDAAYDIRIDNDGDAKPDLTYRFRFSTNLANGGKGISLPIGTETVPIPLRQAGPLDSNLVQPNLNERETYTLTVFDRDASTPRSATRIGAPNQPFIKPIDNIGTKTIPDYAAYADKRIFEVNLPGCAKPGRVFVGQRAEAFAVNLGGIFDLVNLVPIEGDSVRGNGDGQGFPGGITQSRKNDDLVGKKNVTSLALEVPISCVIGNGNGVIGAWTTASLPAQRVLSEMPSYNHTQVSSGGLVQVSRLSNPLVNEVVIGLPDKDLFNAVDPTQDGAVAKYVTNPTLPALLDLLFRDAVNTTLGTSIANLAPTNLPRTDLVAAFLTGFPGLNQQKTVTGSEMIRLNTGIPPTPRNKQATLGLVAEDLAGYPNGRRPGDDTVDIALRVMMGALCHKVPLGAELGVPGAVEDQPSDMINLGYCQPADASVGNVPFTDGAPIRASELQNKFPYLNTPLPGSRAPAK
ncbi:MAG: DUF4331 domain-containing protein [Pseudorhodobacter sp.]|nr:DUF4331 domain-containing protein [Pseudorhodobacter sp.]